MTTKLSLALQLLKKSKKKRKKIPKQNCGTGDIGEGETLHENGSKATGLGAKHTDGKLSKFSLRHAM